MTSTQLFEMRSFFNKFIQLTDQGYEANLTFRSIEDRVNVNLEISFKRYTPPENSKVNRRKAKPSRIRRRERRRQERITVNAETVSATDEAENDIEVVEDSLEPAVVSSENKYYWKIGETKEFL